MADLVYSKLDGVELKEHLEKLLLDTEKYFESRLKAMEIAVEIANDTMKTRLDGMNEFRAALKDANNTKVDRQELFALLDPLRKDIEELKRYRYENEGKASQKDVNVAMLFSGIGLAISVVSLLLRLLGN